MVSKGSLNVGSMNAGRLLHILHQDKKLVNPKGGSIAVQKEAAFAKVEFSTKHATDWSVSKEGVITAAANPNLAVGIQRSIIFKIVFSRGKKLTITGQTKTKNSYHYPKDSLSLCLTKLRSKCLYRFFARFTERF